MMSHAAFLQVLLDLCNQPGFVRTVYANLDCRVERSNLFESICSLLSKSAFPVNVPLASIHLHSLEGLFSILNSLSKGYASAPLLQPSGISQNLWGCISILTA